MKRICLSVLLAASSAFAQSSSGTIAGLITAPGGAAVRNAQVTLVNVDAGTRRETRTNQEGIYAFSLLPPGEYRLETAKAGCAPQRVELGAGEKRSLRLRCTPAPSLQARNPGAKGRSVAN